MEHIVSWTISFVGESVANKWTTVVYSYTIWFVLGKCVDSIREFPVSELVILQTLPELQSPVNENTNKWTTESSGSSVKMVRKKANRKKRKKTGDTSSQQLRKMTLMWYKYNNIKNILRSAKTISKNNLKFEINRADTLQI